MTSIQTFQSGRARVLARVAVSALCALGTLGAAPVIAQTIQSPPQEQTAISGLAEQAAGSVVMVTATRTAADSPGLDLMPDDEFLGEFFRRFGDRGRQMPELPFTGQEPAFDPTRATGSGFVAGPDGLIVTTDALVADAEGVEVTLPDGSTQPAEIVGRDAQTGVALLRIEAETLPALPWGNPNELGLGTSLLMVGRLEGYGTTLSTGVLAARSTEGAHLLIDDAPAAGLVGAPVLNGESEVVAIWTGTADDPETGGPVALASDTAREVIEELSRSGTVARGYLGIQIQPVTSDIAAALGLDQPGGAMVVEVQPDTPAAQAGLQTGDVILSLGDEEISGPEALSPAVANLDPGAEVRLEVWRSEEVVELTATLAALPGSSTQPDTADVSEAGVSVPDLGLTLQPLSPELREAWGLTESSEGVAVLEVDDPGRTDIQEGDLIVSVNRTAVETVEDLEAIEAAKAEGRSSVLLLIDRAGTRTFVPVPLPQT